MIKFSTPSFAVAFFFGFFFCAMPQVRASSCPQASSTSDIHFCASFQAAAQCHCASSGLPPFMCSNMGQLYNRMMATFGNLARVCAYQRDTTAQQCIDDWNCFRNGGSVTSNPAQLCSGIGTACV